MREGARASQRMLVFELISAHANIMPTLTMPSAQFTGAAALQKRDHEVQALLWAFAGQAQHTPLKSSSAVSFQTLAACAAVSAIQ